MHNECLIKGGLINYSGKELKLSVFWVSDTPKDSSYPPIYYLLFKNNSLEKIKPCRLFSDEIHGRKNEKPQFRAIKVINNTVTFSCSFPPQKEFHLYLNYRKLLKNELFIMKHPQKRPQ